MVGYKETGHEEVGGGVERIAYCFSCACSCRQTRNFSFPPPLTLFFLVYLLFFSHFFFFFLKKKLLVLGGNFMFGIDSKI